MRDELNKISDTGIWKYMWCDGYSIYLYSIPFSKGEKKLYEVEDRQSIQIGNRELSPNGGRVAFTLDTDKSGIDVYTIDGDGANLAKVPIGSLKNIFLITFLGNNKLLFADSVGEKNLAKPGTSVIYVVDLNTNEIEKFSNQELNLNFSTASSDGGLLVSTSRDGFIVYDTMNGSSKAINLIGDRPVISPDGKSILFRRGGMTGDYYITGVNGSGETLVLSEEKIRRLLQSSGSYRDLQFASWSPDSKFILLLESSDLQKNEAFVLNIETKEIINITGKQ